MPVPAPSPSASPPQALRRAPLVRIYDVGDRTVVLAADGTRHELAGDSAALARAVLALLEAVAHRVALHHRVDREVLADITQHVDKA